MSTLEHMSVAVGSLVVRASDSRPEGLGIETTDNAAHLYIDSTTDTNNLLDNLSSEDDSSSGLNHLLEDVILNVDKKNVAYFSIQAKQSLMGSFTCRKIIRHGCCRFFLHPKNPPTWVGIEPANLGLQGQLQTNYATQLAYPEV
ncbi:hypothetical protein TNCV_526981 [Trichonephila clavipes]|nr:hypothetical protein TNCV_526981 [Trichonephila clavipes]